MRRVAWVNQIPLVCAALALAGGAIADDSGVTSMERRLENPITLLFENIRLSEALDVITQTSNINIVVDNRVVASRPGDVQQAASHSNVTERMIKYINLKDVPTGDALTAILARVGLDYSVQDSFVWVSTPEQLRHHTFEQLETRIYELPGSMLPDKNAKYQGGAVAEVDLVSILRRATPMIVEPETGELLSYMRFNVETNQIVVHNAPTNLDRLEQLLKLLLKDPKRH